MSALTRMANGDSSQVTVGANDTVIISASPIPGNEKSVYRVINNLYRKGADVVYESLENIHVSGHACQEEHKIMHSLLKPKYFIPVHGEYRHLKKHLQLANRLGMQESRMLIPDIGNRIEVTSKGIKRLDNVQAGSRLIDGEGIEDEKASVVERAIEGYDLQNGTVDEFKRVIKRSLRNYLIRKTKQSPMVVPVVVEL